MISSEAVYSWLSSQSEVNVTTLDTVRPGETVAIADLHGADTLLYRKLHAMGLVAGRVLTVENHAPFGDPISISALGYKLSLRRSEARMIQVMPAGE